MTRRYVGAPLTAEQIHALINLIGGQFALLDTYVAALLGWHVDTLNDRMWLHVVENCSKDPPEWYFLELNSGSNDVAYAYTLLGILTAIKISGKRSTAGVLVQRVAEAFDIKEGECRALGLPCPRRGTR